MRREIEFTCTICQKKFRTINYKKKDGTDRKFCSRQCAGKTVKMRFGGKKLSEEHKTKIKESLQKFNKEHPERRARGEFLSKRVGLSTKGKYKKSPKSILEFSKRTVTKILVRIKANCSRCGWNEGTCDIHHIRGKKIENPDDHSNLSCLCPNCHRLATMKKLKPEDIIPLTVQFGNTLFDHYYG